jgi:hypothetical protein
MINVKRAVCLDEIPNIRLLRIYKGSDYMGEESDWKTSMVSVKTQRKRY